MLIPTPSLPTLHRSSPTPPICPRWDCILGAQFLNRLGVVGVLVQFGVLLASVAEP